MTNQRKHTSVLRASTSISVITLLSRILGLVRDAVIARFFGAGLYTDAFYAAFKIPNLLRRLVAEGSLSTAFVPIFTDELERSEEGAKETIRSTTSFLLIVTIFFTILGIFFAEELTLLFAPGWESDSVKGKLAADLLVVMSPYIIVVSLTALSTSALNSLHVFAIPASAQAILNVGMIFGALTSALLFATPIFGLAWSVIYGGILALIPQLMLLKRLGFPCGLGKITNSPALRRLITMMLPSIVSSSLYQFVIFINLVMASMLQEGSVSWLYYADRLFQFPLGVFTLAVAQAVLPALSRFASAKNEEAFSQQLTKALNWISLICIPSAVGLILLAQPLTEVIYEGGTFSANDTLQTTGCLQAYALGLWALSAQSILVRAFLAHKNAKFPAIVSSVSMVINVLLTFVLMGPPVIMPSSSWGQFIYSTQMSLYQFSFGHIGVALSGSIAAFIALIWMGLSLKPIGVILEFSKLFNCIAKSCLSATIMAGLILLLQTSLDNASLLLAISLPTAILIYFIVLKAMRCVEVDEMLAVFIRKYTAKN